jgi:hypothetical protein
MLRCCISNPPASRPQPGDVKICPGCGQQWLFLFERAGVQYWSQLDTRNLSDYSPPATDARRDSI